MSSTGKITEKIWPYVFRELVMGKIKQADLATAANLTQSAVSQYLAGTRNPGAWELYRIARYLGVSMEYLLTGEGGGKPAASSLPRLRGTDRQELMALAQEARRVIAQLEERIKKF